MSSDGFPLKPTGEIEDKLKQMESMEHLPGEVSKTSRVFLASGYSVLLAIAKVRLLEPRQLGLVDHATSAVTPLWQKGEKHRFQSDKHHPRVHLKCPGGTN